MLNCRVYRMLRHLHILLASTLWGDGRGVGGGGMGLGWSHRENLVDGNG